MKAMEMSRKHLLLIKAALNSHINELLDRKDMIERRRYRAGILSEEYVHLESEKALRCIWMNHSNALIMSTPLLDLETALSS